jgi:hypothetical protein
MNHHIYRERDPAVTTTHPASTDQAIQLELFTSVFPCINAWFVAPGYVGLSFVNSTEDTSFIGGIETLLLAMLLLMLQITPLVCLCNTLEPMIQIWAVTQHVVAAAT